jgi:hypothetical protein
MTHAQQFETATKKKYRFDLNSFKWSIGPSRWDRKPGVKYHCQYEVTFSDGSTCHVIMTDRQRECISRTKLYNIIEQIGGEGYRQLI